MTQYSNFVKKNIKAGKTIYLVRAFPAERSAVVTTVRVGSRPFRAHVSGACFVHMYMGQEFYERCAPGEPPTSRSISLKDSHLFPGNRYNFQRAFTSKKKALAYADLVRAGSDVRSMFGYSAAEVAAYLVKSKERLPARQAIFPESDSFYNF